MPSELLLHGSPILEDFLSDAFVDFVGEEVLLVFWVGFVDCLDGVEAAGDLEGLYFEVVLEEGGVEGGRGYDDFEVFAVGEDGFYQTDDDVDADGALVGLVDDQTAVVRE
jgi:hypothetical protein